MNSVLFTPPLSIETANSANYAVYCNVLNASSSPRTGTLEIVDFSGETLSSSGYNSVAPGVGTGIQIGNFGSSASIMLLYGRIAVDGDRDSIRANLLLIDANGNTLVSLEAH
jgi:hypothetical protein